MTDPVVHVVLVGLMGAGKSTVGQALAARLGRPFRDSDLALQRKTGMTADQLAERFGPEELHELEREQVRAALRAAEPAVIAAAASVVEDGDIGAALASHQVVWLRASVETLLDRFHRGAHRPDFGGDPEVLLRQQAQRRASLYGRLADHVVETGERDVASVVRAIEVWLDG